MSVELSDTALEIFHITLTGIADEDVREELQRLCRYETSDNKTFRISQHELMRMRTAMAQRLGEERPHPVGALWTELQVFIHEPSDADGFFDDTLIDS